MQYYDDETPALIETPKHRYALGAQFIHTTARPWSYAPAQLTGIERTRTRIRITSTSVAGFEYTVEETLESFDPRPTGSRAHTGGGISFRGADLMYDRGELVPLAEWHAKHEAMIDAHRKWAALPLYQQEFGAATTLPQQVLDLLATGELLDNSWHNDTAPSFIHREADHASTDETDLRLWVYPEDPADRADAPDATRFNVCDQADEDGGYLIATNDIDEAIAVLRAKAAAVHASRVEWFGCPECERSNGPHYRGPCSH